MKILSFRSHAPSSTGEFVARNPNMSYLAVSAGANPSSAVIDASAGQAEIGRELATSPSRLEYILLTHLHPDHLATLTSLVGSFPEVRIGLFKSSLDYLAALGFTNLFPLENGTIISLGEEELSVVATPGHTHDSICFRDVRGNHIFTGDTLFGGGIGCCDYSSGGNRNIFYQTIVSLLEDLPPETLVYPGHFSEHHQTMPPYDLSNETIKNPYVANALRGRRGAFDRDLKAFSIEFERNDHKLVNAADIDRICELEESIWIPELQASRETILTRLLNGHQLLAVTRRDELIGMIGWCYARFSIEDNPQDFPPHFSNFSTCRPCDLTNARSAFIYSVGVRAGFRQSGTGSYLLQGAFEHIRAAGIEQVFVDSRLPAYSGSQADPHENIAPIPEFKAAVDRHLAGQGSLDDPAITTDPRVRFYMSNGFRPWLIRRDFIQDRASDNMRIICYINLEQDDRP